MRKSRSGKWNVKLIKLICEHIVVIYILLCVNVNKLVFSLAAFLKSVCTLAFNRTLPENIWDIFYLQSD